MHCTKSPLANFSNLPFEGDQNVLSHAFAPGVATEAAQFGIDDVNDAIKQKLNI